MSDIVERDCCSKAALFDDYVATVAQQRAEIERLRAEIRAILAARIRYPEGEELKWANDRAKALGLG